MPPQSLEAEHAILGALLVAPRAIDEVADRLTPDDFYRLGHGMIFDAALQVSRAGNRVDLVSVNERMVKAGTLEPAGGTGYLMELANAVATVANLDYYVDLVRQKSAGRRLIALGYEIVGLGFDAEPSAIDQATSLLLEVQGREDSAGELRPFRAVLDDAFGEIERAYQAYTEHDGSVVVGRTMTGLRDLDQMVMGAGREDLIYVAARPRVGKSSLLMQIGLNIASGAASGEPIPVAAFSLEMASTEIAKRLLSADAAIDGENLIRGSLADHHWPRLTSAIGRLSHAPLYLDESSDITVARIRAASRRLKMRNGGRLGAVLVDYLGLIGDDPSGKRRDANREQEVARNSRALKQLGRELGCPVFVACQLNRALESRPDKRPTLSDLRESGSIEQDANQVWALYRDELYNPETVDKGVCEVLVLKNRGGKTGTVKMLYRPSTTSFEPILLPGEGGPEYQTTVRDFGGGDDATANYLFDRASGGN